MQLCTNEVDTITDLSYTKFSLLEILKNTSLSDTEAQAERAGGGRTLRTRKARDAGPGLTSLHFGIFFLLLINFVILKVNSLLRAMDTRGSMMEELETVVNLYRENLKDIRESEDSVDAIVNIHNANVKLIERALLDVTDTNSVNSSPSAIRWDVVQDSEGKLIQKQASELLDS